MADHSSSSSSNASSSPLLSLVLTSATAHIIPAILVRISLSVFYRLFPKKQPRPEHAKRVHAFIVLAYVAYTIISHSLAIREDNYYALLGLETAAPNNHVALIVGGQTDPSLASGLAQSWKDTTLRQRWLALVRRFHPDKLGGHPDAVAYFRKLQVAHETLKTDGARRIYERSVVVYFASICVSELIAFCSFGPAAVLSLLPTQTFTERDAVVRGVLGCVGWYVVSFGIFVLMPRIVGKVADNKSFVSIIFADTIWDVIADVRLTVARHLTASATIRRAMSSLKSSH